jgi:DNA polymerase-3 subunit epsilon
MVAGQRIDDDHVAAVVREANLIVAHNANFDRRFLERRLPIFQAKAWACSRNDVPWEEHGFASTKLEWLAYKLCGMFYEAHHADSDCYMAVHLLASRLPSGELVMSRLLRSARQTTVRLAAVGAPYEMKDVLKRRGYRWNDGTDGMPRAWWKTLPEPHADAELEWLSTEVYPTAIYRCVRNRIDATIRHSGRQPL